MPPDSHWVFLAASWPGATIPPSPRNSAPQTRQVGPRTSNEALHKKSRERVGGGGFSLGRSRRPVSWATGRRMNLVGTLRGHARARSGTARAAARDGSATQPGWGEERAAPPRTAAVLKWAGSAAMSPLGKPQHADLSRQQRLDRCMCVCAWPLRTAPRPLTPARPPANGGVPGAHRGQSVQCLRESDMSFPQRQRVECDEVGPRGHRHRL